MFSIDRITTETRRTRRRKELMVTIALLAPLNFVDSLLLKFFSEQTVNYVIWPFIQVGAVVTITAALGLSRYFREEKGACFLRLRVGPLAEWGRGGLAHYRRGVQWVLMVE